MINQNITGWYDIICDREWKSQLKIIYDYFQIVTSSPSHFDFFLKHYGIPLKMSFFI